MVTKTVFLTTAGAGTWTAPADFNPSNNRIITIGGGAGGTNNATTGGGGGEWSESVNVALAASATAYYNVGGGGAYPTNSGNGGDTWFNKSANSAPGSASDGALAKGGTQVNLAGSGNISPGGTGGVGTTKYAGGNGAGGSYSGGGGGAGSYLGAGKLAGEGGSGSTGGGGGAAGGGSVGGAGGATYGGVGGNNSNSTDGGGNNPVTAGAGRDGFPGAGGGGGSSSSTAGGAGAPGREYQQTSDSAYAGAGGGGGGEYSGGTAGGNGGLYGGGAGSRRSAVGGQGLIVIQWEVSAAPVFSGTVPAKTGATGAAFSWTAPTLASYFTGSGITFTVSTALSAIGLSIDGSTGVISGTGTTGTWTGTVTATNVDGSDTSNSFTITISAAPADLSAPTVTSVGATTATCGFSTDTATGNGYFLRRTGLSAASAATIISTGESQAISGTGAQTRAMTAFTSGLTYYVDMAQTGSTEVVTAGPFYPGTGRPVSDVDVTGWTASTGSDLWAMLDEDTASDSDYVTSPALSGSATTGSHALDKTYTAGTYSIKVRAKTDTGAGTLVVRLLNGSNVSQGVTADQAITSTWTTYTLPITITGDATRIRYEVVAA